MTGGIIMTQYLKIWMGTTSGSYHGRDDGYPERKSRIYSSIGELAKQHGTQSNENYYKLEEVDYDEMEDLIEKTLEEENNVAKIVKRDRLEQEIRMKEKELRELNM